MGFRKWFIDKFASDIIEAKLKEEVARLAGDIVNGKNYQRLSKRGDGDLPAVQYTKSQQLAQYLYFSNPLARRMMEYQKVYIIGDGVIWKAPDDETRAVIQKHWDDPINKWEIKQNQKALELGLWGEQIYPVFINKDTGLVKLGVISPLNVDSVVADTNNPEIKVKVIARFKEDSGSTRKKEYTIIQDPKMTEPLDTDGEENYCFYYSVNGLSNTNRGYSDLLSLEDWIDAYDKIVFDFVERSAFLQSFLWDITMDGATKTEIDKKKNELETEPPNTGSFTVHNEREIWKAITPDIRSRQNIEEARHIRNIVLAGMGYPEYWFAEGEKTTRACYSIDTETLTENGWKNYYDIRSYEKIATFNPKTNSIEYRLPIGNYIYDYEGEMHHFNNKNHDILVTPEHKMWTSKREPDGEWKKVQAKDFTDGRYYFKVAAEWYGDENKIFTLPSIQHGVSRAVFPEMKIETDTFLEFLGYFLSEGSLRRTQKSKHSYAIEVSQKKGKKANKIKKLFDKFPIDYQLYESKGDILRFNINDKALWTWLYDNVGTLYKNKTIPRQFMNLATRQLKILFDAMMLGDGSIDKRGKRTAKCYYSASKQLIKDFQELALKCGYQAKTMKGCRCERVLMTSKKNATVWQRTGIKKVPYKGLVYCFEVPNHLFITRRNGKIAIQGNTALAQGAPTLKVLEERQAVVKNMFRDILTFQAYQAQARGMIKKTTEIKVFVDMPELEIRNYDEVFGALVKLVQGLVLAVERGLMTQELAIIVLDRFLFRAGFEFNADDQIEALIEAVQDHEYDKLNKTLRNFDKLSKYRKDLKLQADKS